MMNQVHIPSGGMN